jgi:hypothetical protein
MENEVNSCGSIKFIGGSRNMSGFTASQKKHETVICRRLIEQETHAHARSIMSAVGDVKN